MKYMGSKQWMLRNGLGQVLLREARKSDRFIDLFSGSGAVSNFVATHVDVPVLACDLQEFSAALSRPILNRTRAMRVASLWRNWEKRAAKYLIKHATIPRNIQYINREIVEDMRRSCRKMERNKWPITHAYGGHYFSRYQAMWFDALRKTLPESRLHNSAALASLIAAAARAAASPGHTAQPFQPTRTAKRYLQSAWMRDIKEDIQASLRSLSCIYAKSKGSARVGNANDIAWEARAGDLIFIDPPYSSVHYSRFYHVLETIANGKCGVITGIGRYPPPEERPSSLYSIKTKARHAIEELVKIIALNGASIVLTFPNKVCSNGISGYFIRKIAMKYFANVSIKTVTSRFSTLGGTGDDREARQKTSEMIVIMKRPFAYLAMEIGRRKIGGE